MELLKQLLQSANIKITELEKEIKALGFDPSNLSDEDAQKVFDQLKGKREKQLAKSNKSQPSISNNVAISSAVDKSAAQIETMVQNAKTFAAKQADKNATKLIQIMEDIPDLTLQRVRELLGASEELNFFRGSTEDFEQAFSSKFDIE